MFCEQQGQHYKVIEMTPSTRARDKIGTKFELIKFHAQTDDVLASHLKNVSLNATYTSRTIQNHLINVSGNYLRKDIITALNTLWSIK